MSDASNAQPKAVVLLVEDEAMLRLIAAEVLTDAGFEVLDTGDGTTALAHLQSDAKIDLVVTDVRMPGLSGYQLVEKGMKLRPQAKFLLVTGFAYDPLPPELAAAGVQVIHKPFDFQMLAKLAGELLKI